MQLPNWTQKVWPYEMEQYALQEFNITSSTKRLQSLTIGKEMLLIISIYSF